MKVVQSFLSYFHAAISSHLSGKPKNVLFYMVANHGFDYFKRFFFSLLSLIWYVFASLIQTLLTLDLDVIHHPIIENM